MILEGIVTTLGLDDAAHVAAMGAVVDPAMESLVLRPFRSSSTCQNLRRHGYGVFHVTDDVEQMVAAALGRNRRSFTVELLPDFSVPRLADCCRWYAFHVDEIDARDERTSLACRILERGCQREFFGFNRAKHAILELTIMATRMQWLPAVDVTSELERTRVILAKTGGAAEERALNDIRRYLEECWTSHAPIGTSPG